MSEATLPEPDQALLEAVVGAPGPRQRRAVAKAITLLESTRADHRLRADALLNALLPASGGSFRLGLSGVPGVGKSTFIEALGLYLIAQGHRVAVLAVDPSSSLSGGSILGDKTRMEQLSVHEQAYIRPSPASGTLGGVAEKTREAMLVCEAAEPQPERAPAGRQQRIEQRIGAQAVVCAGRFEQRDGFGHRAALARTGRTDDGFEQRLVRFWQRGLRHRGPPVQVEGSACPTRWPVAARSRDAGRSGWRR